jgi:hypothetical protein
MSWITAHLGGRPLGLAGDATSCGITEISIAISLKNNIVGMFPTLLEVSMSATAYTLCSTILVESY